MCPCLDCVAKHVYLRRPVLEAEEAEREAGLGETSSDFHSSLEQIAHVFCGQGSSSPQRCSGVHPVKLVHTQVVRVSSSS